MGKTLFLYSVTVFIWGSTWLGIKYQLGVVDPLVSVIYRFSLASLILLIWCISRQLKMRFSFGEHLFIALQGACLFAINYWLFYIAEIHLTSGIVAVIFSTIVFWNMLNSRIFLKRQIKGNVIFGSLLGILGIGLVFWPEFSDFSLTDSALTGLLLSLCATLMASFGNILSARNQSQGLPVVQTNAYGMTYATLIMIAAATITNRPFTLEPTAPYLFSLFYLALLGSVIAFGCYLTLIGRIGVDRAAYATLLFPIVALAISTVAEGYHWTPAAVAGVIIILTGNALSLAKIHRSRHRRKNKSQRF